MRKNIFILAILFLIGLTCCTNSDITEKKRVSFSGVWEVIDVKYLNDENEYDKNVENLVGGRIRIEDGSIDILGDKKNRIEYKLKVIKEDYTLSYENNLTMKEFMGERNSVDLISIIDKGQIVAEMFLDNNGDILFLYKSLLFKLNRINDKELDRDFKNVDITNSEIKGEYDDYKEGVMIGLKTPREKEEDGTYTVEEYRTIWVSYDDGKLGGSFEKTGIIFPRISGIWKLGIREIEENNKYYDKLEVSKYDEVEKEGDTLLVMNENEFKTINFVCNDYIAIKKYIGNNFNGEYPIYQIIPISNINIANGLHANEVFSEEEEGKYLSELRRKSDEIKGSEIDDFDINNISIGRNSGKWVFISNLISDKSYENEDEIKLSIYPNNRFVRYNSLYIPWKTLKAELGFIKDALISPLGKFAIIQFDDYIAMYIIEDGQLISEPIGMIEVEEDEEIIMAEWSSGSYVDQWENIFKDGDVIKID